MDNQRVFLFIALSLIGLMLWQAWQEDYVIKKDLDLKQVDLTQSLDKDIPQLPVSSTASSQSILSPQNKLDDLPGQASALPAGDRITIQTDVFNVEMSSIGGDIRKLDLIQYPIDVKVPEKPFKLLNDIYPEFFIIQSGLLSNPSNPSPTHKVTYRTEKQNYSLKPGDDTLTVSLIWDNDQGVEFTKIYTFYRNSYLIDVSHQIINKSKSIWKGNQYRQIQRSDVDNNESAFIYTYTGGVIYDPIEKYQKINFDDMKDKNLKVDNITEGWAAMIQHYFLAAWIPEKDEVNQYYSKVPGRNYILGMVSTATKEVKPEDTYQFNSRLFIGPKLQNTLETIAPGLELTVDYGILTVLAKPIFWLLNKIYSLVQNWGWAIIILTILIKLAFYKLSEASYKSMANMRKLQPRLQSMKERYGDDRQKMNQAMMEMYKKEKINPLGGCLPVLVQIPVFIALYWVLLESVELRQASFALWLNNLSDPDPYFVLPLIMGVTMIIQQKLNPTPLDPIQAKVMMMLPIIFTVFFAFFPSGLVLYWVVNNTLSIGQQWLIMKRVNS